MQRAGYRKEEETMTESAVQQEELNIAFDLGQNLFFLLALLASAAVLAIGVIYLLRKIGSRSSSDAGRTFRFFVLFILGATALLSLPAYYVSYPFGDGCPVIRPILLAIFNAMRVLILNGEFDFISVSIRGMNGVLHVVFSLYAAVLYVAAPAVFSFTIFIIIFRDAFAGIQLFLHRKARLYVFSCLNEESAAMARSILQPDDADGAGSRTPADEQAGDMIVFCGVPQDEEERKAQIALAPSVNDKRAYIILTGKAVDEINTSRFQGEITFFLMDRDETKNIQDASALSMRLEKKETAEEAADGSGRSAKSQKQPDADKEGKTKPVPRILVYASSPSSVPLIEALAKRMEVPDRTVDRLVALIDDACSNNSSFIGQSRILKAIQTGMEKEALPLSDSFFAARIDTKVQMALRIVQELRRPEAFYSAEGEERTVTVTLLGLGGVGKEILETLLWMYQEYKLRLIINVFDATGPELGEDPDAARNPLYDRLALEWPELMETNRAWQNDPGKHPDTESEYDIRFFLGTDCFSNRFRRLFDVDSETGKRLLRSDMVICTLGDDDKNQEAAMMMRQLFAGNAVEAAGEGKEPGKDELYSRPDIYAIVYDDQRSDCISSRGQITNYKEIPYNITTMGSMRTQYSFAGIRKLDEVEKAALVHHIAWICTSTETDENPWTKKKEEEKTAILKDELSNYAHYEYYRRSSLSKAIHRNSLEERRVYQVDESLLTDITRHDRTNPACRCPLCRSRITEHMRWNAYMRLKGYRYCKKRNDMAKLHPCLQPWSELPVKERIKD